MKDGQLYDMKHCIGVWAGLWATGIGGAGTKSV